jgi:hypothetical protein
LPSGEKARKVYDLLRGEMTMRTSGPDCGIFFIGPFALSAGALSRVRVPR